MQRPTRDGMLLDAWFLFATQILQSGDRWLLGGWIRFWINNPNDIRALAWVGKLFKPFLYPVCQPCGRMWTYQCHFSHAHFMGMCRARIVQADTCFTCHNMHPVLSPMPTFNGRPFPFGLREVAFWSKECARCGLQYSDMFVHDMYVCSHPPIRAVQDDESSLSSDTRSADSEDLVQQYLARNYPDSLED